MTRKLKALGLVLVTALVLGAIGAQGALGADAHEFHSDGEKTILTGKNITALEFAVGSAGIVRCEEVTVEGTSVGTKVSDTTYKVDTLTVRPIVKNCTFGGQSATVVFNHCAHVYDSDTTAGNPTGGKHATVELECAAGSKVQVHTVNCTITFGAQTMPDRVRYENDPENQSAIKLITTAHGIVVGRERNTASQPVNGCLTFPTGAFGKLVGTTTAECRKDESSAQADPTTPEATQDAETTNCTVTDV